MMPSRCPAYGIWHEPNEPKSMLSTASASASLPRTTTTALALRPPPSIYLHVAMAVTWPEAIGPIDHFEL
jgi:hypothetical protein